MINIPIQVFGFSIHWIFVPFCFLTGLIIITFRPYWGFLFAVFLNLSFGPDVLFLLRIPGIGPYFNLNDVCMYLSIIAFLAERRQSRDKFIFPRIILAILIVITIGFLQSRIRYPNNFYYTLRGLQWAIHLPIYFIIGANLVKGENRIRQLLLTIVFGGCFASLQYIFWIMQTRQILGPFYSPTKLRNIGFLRASQSTWLITGAFVAAGKIPKKWFQIAVGILFLIVTLTHQTRSIAIAGVGAFLIYYLWFLRDIPFLRFKKFVFLSLIVGITILLMIPLKFTSLSKNYWHRIVYSWEYRDSALSLETRKADFHIELEDWLYGNMIIGEGLYYYPRHAEFKLGKGESLIDVTGAAFGHLGYINILSQFGILGFLVYAVWLQWSILIRARRAYIAYQKSPWFAYASALTAVMYLFITFVSFFTSTPYFSPGAVLPAILAGLIWRVTLRYNPEY